MDKDIDLIFFLPGQEYIQDCKKQPLMPLPNISILTNVQPQPTVGGGIKTSELTSNDWCPTSKLYLEIFIFVVTSHKFADVSIFLMTSEMVKNWTIY